MNSATEPIPALAKCTGGCGNPSDPKCSKSGSKGGIPTCLDCFKDTQYLLKQFKSGQTIYDVSIDQILDNLYLGNEDASMDLETLKSKNITHILAAGNYLKMYHPDQFEYLHIPIHDYPSVDLFPHFKAALSFMKKGNVVFAHCAAGVSRSASMTIAFLMATKGWSYDEAHDYVKSKRDVIRPNPGFVEQLKKLEEMIKSKEFTLEE